MTCCCFQALEDLSLPRGRQQALNILSSPGGTSRQGFEIWRLGKVHLAPKNGRWRLGDLLAIFFVHLAFFATLQNRFGGQKKITELHYVYSTVYAAGAVENRFETIFDSSKIGCYRKSLMSWILVRLDDLFFQIIRNFLTPTVATFGDFADLLW